MRPPVTLQISLAPSDHRLAAHLLPHQVCFWRDQVDEVLLTIDTRRSPGRFGDEWEKGRENLLRIAGAISGARIAEVDYGAEARARVAGRFFAGRAVPVKDCRGGPYYSYFFALAECRHDLILHTDADMFFGGSAATWMPAALQRLAADPGVLFLAPLPGPPAPDGRLRQLTAERLPGPAPAFRFPEMSTRLFLTDRARWASTLGPLKPRFAGPRGVFRALVDGNPPRELPEVLISAAMRERGLRREDFLGPGPGCWSLHPPYRCAEFYRVLPELVRRVESSDIPSAQLGDHDFNGAMVDWSEAITGLARRRWWRRLAERFAETHA